MAEMKKMSYQKLGLLFLIFVLIVGLTGCSESIEDRQEKVQDAIENALSSFDVTYELDIKSNELNNYVTDEGKKTNYYFNVYIDSNATVSNEEIFNIIKAVDAVNVNYTSIYRFYDFNGESYYIQDECILICGNNYDVAYTPIAQKYGEELSYSEKKAISNWIESKYKLYDLYDGEYTGDKYSDELFELAAQTFNVPIEDLKIIWMDAYTD